MGFADVVAGDGVAGLAEDGLGVGPSEHEAQEVGDLLGGDTLAPLLGIAVAVDLAVDDARQAESTGQADGQVLVLQDLGGPSCCRTDSRMARGRSARKPSRDSCAASRPVVPSFGAGELSFIRANLDVRRWGRHEQALRLLSYHRR
jgi:hypothetical protein